LKYRGKMVKVRVRRSDGRPAIGAMVSVPRSTAPVPELALVADADGVATFYLPTGRYTVEAFTEDGSSGSAEIAVEGGSMTLELQVEGGGR
jgi:hypothetical protein